MLAAVCFLIMMFNVPIPDGTTAHGVGGALIAILLGPWAAVIAVSVALGFQALLFGDGGVLAYGVNVLNMAVILPFVAYGLYRMISGNAYLTSPRRVVAAFIAGYVGLTVSALCVGIELGIQPDLFHDASGAPLYSPYHLSQSIPAMLFAHLTVAGTAEGIIAAAVLAYLQRANLPLLQVNHPGVPVDAEAAAEEGARRRRLRPGVVAAAAMALMVVLTPLGLLAQGTAFGEDAPDELKDKLGLSKVPEGLNKYAEFWRTTLFPDYGFASGEHPVLSYIVSAVVGILIVGLVVFLIAKLVTVAATRRNSTADSRRSEEVRS
jgi:cobalt/nickel transport system permease protein